MNKAAIFPFSDRSIAEILSFAHNVLSEKGSDGASMHDLARNAGMSVGNFYHYFPSKATIIDHLLTVSAYATATTYEFACNRWKAYARFIFMMIKSGGLRYRSNTQNDALQKIIHRNIDILLGEIAPAHQKG